MWVQVPLKPPDQSSLLSPPPKKCMQSNRVVILPITRKLRFSGEVELDIGEAGGIAMESEARVSPIN